jgi:hypothetical protein
MLVMSHSSCRLSGCAMRPPGLNKGSFIIGDSANRKKRQNIPRLQAASKHHAANLTPHTNVRRRARGLGGSLDFVQAGAIAAPRVRWAAVPLDGLPAPRCRGAPPLTGSQKPYRTGR